MRKTLLGFVFLVIMAVSAEAKTITLSKCDPLGMKEYEKYDFVIDLDNKILKNVMVYNDKAVEKYTQSQKKLGISGAVEKIKINEYKIVYSDSQFVKASQKFLIFENKPDNIQQFDFDIDLKKKTLNHTRVQIINGAVVGDGYKIQYECEKSSGGSTGSGAKGVLDKILR